MKKNKVAVIMGSQSDLPKMRKVSAALKKFKISHSVSVISAHRAPSYLKEHIEKSEKNGTKVFIAGAGMAAHLAGAVASLTARPVIGVPLSSPLNGFDSLLSTVQMPREVPVATVAVDGAFNAALLAAQILATEDAGLFKKLTGRKKFIEKEIGKTARR